MPAHLRSLKDTCAYAGCQKRAEQHLFNTWNAPIGKYCEKHAYVMLRKALDQEAKSG